MNRAIVVLILCLCSSPAYGWNTYGHEVVAAVAWQHLTPDERTVYTAILKAHPHYHDDLEYGVP